MNLFSCSFCSSLTGLGETGSCVCCRGGMRQGIFVLEVKDESLFSFLLFLIDR